MEAYKTVTLSPDGRRKRAIFSFSHNVLYPNYNCTFLEVTLSSSDVPEADISENITSSEKLSLSLTKENFHMSAVS